MGKLSRLRGDHIEGGNSAGPSGPAEATQETYYVWQYDESLDQTEFLGTTYEQQAPNPLTFHLTEEQHLGVLDRETIRFEIAEKP